MVPKRVFITRSLLSDGAEFLEEKGLMVEVNREDRTLGREELMARAKSADALITVLSDQIDAEFLKANAHLKIIANYAVGFNNIDVAAARALGISVTNTPDVLTEATAETALGLLISASRNFQQASQSVTSGTWTSWSPQGHLGPALKGKTLGIVGMGRIGKRLAEMAHFAFQMPVLYTSHSPKENDFKAQKVTLDELCRKSDFISLHVPLTEETRGLVGKKEFQLMKPHAVLVNTARGEVVDQNALIEALAARKIFAAGLDVMTPEPLPLTSELLKLPNVFLLPHIGSATFEARRNMALLCAENVWAGLTNRKLLSPV